MLDKSTDTLTRYYDEVPYDSHPFPQSAIEHLATSASLFGLSAPDITHARVLELGCASGGNLIPFASRFPQAMAVGIDLSGVQIALARATAERAGLKNIEFQALDIVQLDAVFGRFDYIVCHGVYSWVPAPVQEAILKICSELLTPDGVAYISYNTYPGWKAREIVRDAMLLRGGARQSPEEKLSFGRGMLEFLDRSAPPDSILKKAIEGTMPIIRNAAPSYLLHEFFEPVNSPCYFNDFLQRAGVHGLTYLAESESSSMFVRNYAEDVREPLMHKCGGSQVVMEQYLDFLVNRTFRQTLLVNADHADSIRYRLDSARLRAMSYAGRFPAVDGAPLRLDATEQQCTAPGKRTVTLRRPVHKAFAELLGSCFPAALDVDAIMDGVASRVQQSLDDVQQPVMEILEELVILGAIYMRKDRPDVASRVESHPRVLAANCSLFASLPHGERPLVACNQWHEEVGLSPLESFLLPLCDGTRSHDALESEVTVATRANQLLFSKNGQPVDAAEVEADSIRAELQSALNGLQQKGLFVS